VMTQAGCHDPVLEYLSKKPSSMALGGELLSDIRDMHPDVDAVFFCNDDLAQGGVLAALRRGLKVPEQLAIAGFNDLAGSDQMWPPLTTIRTPRVQIGESAATMLLQLMRGEAVLQSSIDLGWELVQRHST
jgi:LacI family gluconate utilization system Gnt-I transcriptional repressor